MMLNRTRHMLQLLREMRASTARSVHSSGSDLHVVDVPPLPDSATAPSMRWLHELPDLVTQSSKLWLRGPPDGFGALRAKSVEKGSIFVSGSVWLFLLHRPPAELSISGSGSLWLWWWEGRMCLRILHSQPNAMAEAKAPYRCYALLIGVSHYTLEPHLPYVKADIEQLSGELIAHGYEVDRLLSDPSGIEKEPTKDNIESHLQNLKNVAAGKDLLWVHYSGHGKFDGKLQLSAKNGKFAKDLIVESMFKSGSKRLVLTIDACNSGTRSISTPHESAFLSRSFRNYVCLSACAQHQLAYPEDDKNSRSVFSAAIIEGLKEIYAAPVAWTSGSQRWITVGSMFCFVSQRLARWSRSRRSHEQQNPTIENLNPEEIILVDLR